MGSEEELKYTFYGSQLEELNEDDLWAKKPIPIEDQVATDKQGRRRFHGAFTGGFSAGYFNTVGSEEGWTPTTFKSTRAEKNASKVQQRPEDFMDDEDQEVFGIAPKVLRARQEYKKASSRPSTSSGLLDSLLKPVRDTVGVVLLKRMGWRPGQGVGPRQTAREKRERRKLVKKTKKVYGCTLGPEPAAPAEKEVESEEEWSDENEEVTFAPDDLPSFPVAPKTNTFGMGYVGLDKNSQLLSSKRFSLFEEPETVMNAKKASVGMKGQAFGVGAFEKEDDDIYAGDDMSRYDFFLESTTESKKRRMQEKKAEMEKKKRHNESKCLQNFLPAKQKMATVKFYPAPQIPKHFIPKHGVRQSRFSEQKPAVAERLAERKGRHDLTAKERAILVGEAEKERKTESLAAPKPLPVLDFEVVPTELKPGQFNPFKHNQEKLKRYQQYLTLRNMKQTDKFICLQPLVMTEWEKGRERDEFEQAAVLYQPLAGQISDRFVSSSTLIGSEETPKMKEELPVEETVKAAKLRMFGKMTRTTEPWHPCALLCKRFNVPVPHSGLAPTDGKKKPSFSVFDFLAAQPETPSAEAPKKSVEEQPEASTSASKPASGAQAPVATPAPQESQLPAPKPREVFTTEKMTVEDKMDLFKSVFLSSSEDEEEPAPPAKEPTPPLQPKRRKSPGKGVFKSLDLIAPREKPSKPVPPPPAEVAPKVPEPNPNLYGPALPPPVPSASNSTSEFAPSVKPVSDLEGKWVEKRHKRSKSKKKRSRSSSKKRRKRDSSSSSSDGERHKKKKHKKHKR